jgi:glycerol uptake facilitator-like aquaporin
MSPRSFKTNSYLSYPSPNTVAVEKHRSTPFAPCAIGLVLFATHLFGVIYTGAAVG